MVQPRSLRPDTLALHAGGGPDPATGARAVPIYQTTSFCFESTDEAAALFDLQTPGHVYSRISNPTVSAFEERMAALEGGVAAVATASGQAALHLAIATILSAGDRIVASRNVYGGTCRFLKLTLPRFGIETELVDIRDHAAIEAAMDGRVKLLLTETLGNPGLEVADIPVLAAIAHRHHMPLVVDNTFATPCLMRPIEHGADIVMHSATKWIGGHGVAIGGVLVDAGRFDWRQNGRYPTLSEPYEGHAGLVFADMFGPSAFAARARAEGLRDFGACLSPQNAFYLLQGLETLSLRMARHVENTDAVLEFLSSHDDIAYVLHPRHSSHPDHALARKLLPDGAGSVVSFGVRGGRRAGAAFIENCRLASHLANVGDTRTLAIHPASTTHAQLGPEALAAMGVHEDMVRLSIGIEDVADILEDLANALKSVSREVRP